MKNLYQSWLQYQKQQNIWLKSLSQPLRIPSPEGSWGQVAYPRGEDWKYVDFSKLSQQQWQLRSHAEQPIQGEVNDDFCHLVISDFSRPMDWVATGLPAGLRILNIRQVLADEDLKKHYLSLLQGEENSPNPMAESVLSFAGLGLYIEFDKNVEKAVKITLDLEQSAQKELANFHCLVRARSGSQAKVFFEVRGASFQGYCQSRFDMDLDEKSQLSFHGQQMGSEESFFHQSVQAQLQKDASLRLWDVTLPGAWSRHDSHVHLNGAQAEAQLLGLYLGKDSDFTDHHSWTHHHVGRTHSLQNYRGILADRARAVFNGRIFIEKQAAKSSSEQINKNIVLSSQAEVDTKPELQIDNDDVKAAHGATVGQLDKEQMFYLMSRGYNNEQAKTRLCRAFIFDLLENEPQIVQNFYGPSLSDQLSLLKES